MQQLVFDQLGGRTGQHHIAVTRLRPGQVTHWHGHDFFELFLEERGRGLHAWNDQQLPLELGSLVLIRPGDTHRFIGDSNTSLTFINLAISRHWWLHLLELLSPDRPVNEALNGDPPGHLRLAAGPARLCGARMHDLFERGASEPALLVETAAHLLNPLLRHVAATPQERSDAPDWLVAWARAMQDPDLVAQPIRHWQKRAGVSPAHLARSCRKHLGAAPTELLNRARIEHVQAWLRQGEDKVAALALDAGFANLGFFYRCFRRFVGCTPKQWQARHTAFATVPR